ncbi:hypothetical protein QBC41DRAFT_360568 [Cercophora samala]|uniref:Uncharacterized protein n=1 Tax=Cercophora samala TaxID=330535 RepID=A0AA39YTU9_9PEZI|nr:hypothetical protein QBC41DRAFT_360568 [Cercophora samala]
MTSEEEEEEEEEDWASQPCAGSQCPGDCPNEDCPSTWYPYTPQDYTAMFLSFYQFLTTLHYSPADLKTPPPTGWPHLTRQPSGGGVPPDYKTDFALQVMRHLPYLGGKRHYDYKSILIDYSTLDPQKSHWFKADINGKYPEDDWWENGNWPYSLPEGQTPPLGDSLIPLTCGWESGGIILVLDTKRGQILEEVVRCDNRVYDVQEYFDKMKREFSNLELIPCEGRILLGGGKAQGEVLVTDEQFWGQGSDEWWGTDLDVAYIQQIYREHGWPESFRREECFRTVNALLDKVKEKRGSSWEEWDEGHFERAE